METGRDKGVSLVVSIAKPPPPGARETAGISSNFFARSLALSDQKITCGRQRGEMLVSVLPASLSYRFERPAKEEAKIRDRR